MTMQQTPESLAAKFAVLFPHLDERQRRLTAGVEARTLGRGGIRVVARAARMREATVARGVAELEGGAAPLGRARRPGGGRKKAAERDPGLVAALLALVEPDERGDPESPLRWTTKSTRGLAAQLTRAGHPVSARTVADLLRGQGFSLQASVKTLEGARHPDRDAQFRYLNAQARQYLAGGDPVLSVDTKKKEQVGRYHNPGRQWRPAGEPVTVRSHDFPDPLGGTAIPFGIYDLAADTGWVSVGTDHDTAAFAVASLRRWWDALGQASYPRSHRLLITADAGGANGYRPRAWKAELAAFAVDTGLEITVCHLPPGTSKWNKIEHRLFSQITMNWRGRPLTSHEVIVNSIAATHTRTGLAVTAELDTHPYPTGVRISTEQMDALPLTRHDWHGDWNYTLRPEPYPRLPASTPPTSPTGPDHTGPDHTGPDHTGADPFDQPGHNRAWLCHPAITGLATPEWNTLIHTITRLHHQQHQADQAKHRAKHRAKHPDQHGHRPRATRPGIGRRPADRLLATVLHHRHGLSPQAIATLFHLRPATIAAHIRATDQLLAQAGHTLTPAPHPLATLDDLDDLAHAAGITLPTPAKPTSY